MSTLSADLEQAVRAIVRDEIERASGKQPMPALPKPAADPSICGFKTNAGTCYKAPHVGRHSYSKTPPPKEHKAPVRNWERVTDVWFKPVGYLKRTHFVVGNTCRVQGERGLWTIVSIEKHKYEDKINVEVKADRTGHSRTFPVDRIIYKRPKKASS